MLVIYHRGQADILAQTVSPTSALPRGRRRQKHTPGTVFPVCESVSVRGFLLTPLLSGHQPASSLTEAAAGGRESAPEA